MTVGSVLRLSMLSPVLVVFFLIAPVVFPVMVLTKTELEKFLSLFCLSLSFLVQSG